MQLSYVAALSDSKSHSERPTCIKDSGRCYIVFMLGWLYSINNCILTLRLVIIEIVLVSKGVCWNPRNLPIYAFDISRNFSNLVSVNLFCFGANTGPSRLKSVSTGALDSSTVLCTYKQILYGRVFVEVLNSFGITPILFCLYLSRAVLWAAAFTIRF